MTAAPPAEAPSLNQGQRDADDAFFTFLFGSEKEFVISGAAGVGKTHLMGYIIDIILPEYQNTCKLMGSKPKFDEVVMTATTNKAAEGLSLSTKRPTSTIHSFMNLKVTDDYATGRQKLDRTRNWIVHKNKIIFIDEASMIDFNLYNTIHEGTEDCKIVFVGDHCQLAPVGEDLSPVYKTSAPFFVLTEPMRTKDPHLQALNEQLRDTVETGVFHPIRIVPGVIDLLDDALMEEGIEAIFGQQTLDSRILAYTNKRVVQYNDHIREVRQLPETYQIGELLINTHSIQLKAARISVEEEIEIISLAPSTEFIEVTSEVKLEVRKADLKTRIGHVFQDVPLPEDRNHYAELIKYFQKNKNWNRYFFLKNNFPDLRQRDAATLHKAQGSTYDNVFVDLANVSTCNMANVVARLLYVGLSRAKYRVFLYGELASKYGGLIY